MPKVFANRMHIVVTFDLDCFLQICDSRLGMNAAGHCLSGQL